MFQLTVITAPETKIQVGAEEVKQQIVGVLPHILATGMYNEKQ